MWGIEEVNIINSYKKDNGVFYTENESIVKYMTKKLNLNENDTVLEPSVGSGLFVDHIKLKYSYKHITVYDNDPSLEAFLIQKYQNDNIEVIIRDTLFDESLSLMANMNSGFDKIIANPPYGAKISFERRKLLKQLYEFSSPKESYTLFLELCLKLLNPDGILCFIIPDTLLSLQRHQNLRKFILSNYKILEIVKIPTKLFGTVKFQYANMIIITIQNTWDINNEIPIIEKISSNHELKAITDEDYKNVQVNFHKQQSILQSDYQNFPMNDYDLYNLVTSKSTVVLGDLADIKTGFYSGDNKKYMKYKSTPSSSPNRNKLSLVDEFEINTHHYSIEPIHGDNPMFIPILKGVPRKYTNVINHYIKWDISAHNYYKEKGSKARFQNSQYYFKKGIGVPMVKAKDIRATIFENVVFDQSVVGIFPKDEKYFNYILALLNSNVGNKLIHSINHTANNSANYLKRIPIIMPSDLVIREIDLLVDDILTNSSEQSQLKLNQIIDNVYSG